MTNLPLSLIILLYLFSLNLSAQEMIAVRANHYTLNVKNQSDYHLKVETGNKNKTQTKILSPNQLWKRKGYYSKGKLKRQQVRYWYDNDTYQIDKATIERERKSAELAAQQSKEAIEGSAIRDLEYKLLAEAAVNVRTNSNNWFAQAGSWVLRKAGQTVKLAYAFKELLEEIEGYNYSTYQEAFDTFLYSRFEAQVVEGIASVLDKIIGLRAKPVEFVMGSILHCIHQYEKAEENYQRQMKRIEQQYEREIAEIDDLLKTKQIHNQSTRSAYDLIPKSLDLQTRTPYAQLSIEPLTYGNELNQYWSSTTDRILSDDDNNDEYEWENGLWNNSFGGSFRIGISPEMNFSDEFYSRLYGGISYYQNSYDLVDGITLTSNFFATVPTNSTGFRIENPITYQHQRLGFDAVWRFYMGEHFIFDLNGGYAKQDGQLNFKSATLSQGYRWANETISMVTSDYQPFWGAKIGIGWNNYHYGTHLLCGVQFFPVAQTNITDYKIERSSTNLPIDFSSDENLIYRINVGFGIAF